MSMDRNILSDLLLARKYREAMDLIKKRHSRLRILLGLLYSEEELVRWRAVTLLGLIAADGETDLAPAVKKLLWFLNEESSTVGWCSAQAIAEIYRNNPGMARDAIRVVLHLSDDPEISAARQQEHSYTRGLHLGHRDTGGRRAGACLGDGSGADGIFKRPRPLDKGFFRMGPGQDGFPGGARRTQGACP